MGKKITTNPKSLEARERKEAKKRAENDKREKEKEDALWKDDDKLVNRKLNRKEEKEKKKQDDLVKKQENKQLYEEELKELKSAKPVVQKITRAQIERTIEREKAEKEKLIKREESSEPILEENINRLQAESVVASGVDDALKALSLTENEKLEKHPEKRMKAAYTAFEELNLPKLKKENPALRLSQLKQLLKKEWMKSPDNPMNQIFKAYNAK